MGSEECEGGSSAQVGHGDTVLLERNESQTQAYGIRVVSSRGSFYFFVPVATQPAVPFSLKNPVGWPDGPPVESSGETAVFLEINRLKLYYTTLIIVFNILQASIPLSDRLDQSGVTYCN